MTPPVIILHAPQLAENIGAVARAMANFGLRDLRLVAPRDGWPQDRAWASASGADWPLDGARVFARTEDALADLQLVFATTARPRELTLPVHTPREAAGLLHAAAAEGQAVGLLFGGERAGLETADIALTHGVVTVPVDDRFRSLNLAQAVVLACYEWRLATGAGVPAAFRDAAPPADGALMLGLYEQLEAELDASGFFHPPEKRPSMVRNLRAALGRARFTEQEARTFRGVVTALGKGRGRVLARLAEDRQQAEEDAMRRREVMTGGAAAALAAAATAGPAMAQGAGQTTDKAQVAATIRELVTYATPLVEMARVRDTALKAGLGANRFAHRRRLATPEDRGVTTPNVDTLYSSAFLDLRPGPVTIRVPDTGERYFSLALMDEWSNNFAVVGTRTTGGRATVVRVVPPGAKLKRKPDGPGELTVESPTPWVWALARVLVDGDADLPAAVAVQEQLTIDGGPVKPAAETARPPAPDAPARQWAQRAYALWYEAGALPADRPAIQRWTGQMLRAMRMGETKATELAQRALDEARAGGRQTTMGDAPVNGWSYPKPNLGDFGTDYAYRAAVAVAGLAALPVQEATYLRAVGPLPGGAFDGTQAWRLAVPAGGVPTASFWSLTLYEQTPSGSLFFAANPLNRYAIGDRTSGLVVAPDGSLDLWIGNADPGEARRPNWLPAPAGPFVVILRAYLPKPELLDGRWRLPPLQAA